MFMCVLRMSILYTFLAPGVIEVLRSLRLFSSLGRSYQFSLLDEVLRLRDLQHGIGSLVKLKLSGDSFTC